jgi:hypothetical protein
VHREPLNEYEWLKQYDEDYEEAFAEDERDREIPDPVDDVPRDMEREAMEGDAEAREVAADREDAAQYDEV